MLRKVSATRYVSPFREGGSMPALMEADDDGLYVVKLRGAGQGPRALVAEVIAGELARMLGLPVPELVVVDVAGELSRSEPDPEIQELVEASAGTNAGLDFLPGSLPYAPATARPPDPDLAAEIVWFDALVENVDRTPRNPNLLVWHGKLWMIDHGAALYRQHGNLAGADPAAPFDRIAEHVLLPAAGSIAAADERLADGLDRDRIAEAAALVPADWWGEDDPAVYIDFLNGRLEAAEAFSAEVDSGR